MKDDNMGSIRDDLPVQIPAALVRALGGSGNAALLLAHLCRIGGDAEGWFPQTQQDIEGLTGLGEDSQRTARRALLRVGVLEEEYRGLPRRLWFRLDARRLADLMDEFGAPRFRVRGGRR